MSKGLCQDLDSRAVTQQWARIETPRQLTKLFVWCVFLPGKPASLWKITASWQLLLREDTPSPQQILGLTAGCGGARIPPRRALPGSALSQREVSEQIALLASQRGGVKKSH